MSGFSHKHNTDDVLIRAIMVGLINAMSEKINFENTVSDTEKKLVNVPFFYNFSGDERFIQDYFSDWSDCTPQLIEGNYDVIPRGSLSITGINIVATNLTSRFVRGNYNKEVNGELLKYNSYLNSIPLNIAVHAEVLVDSSVDSFKITQSIIREVYKTLVFRVNFGGTVIPSQAGFPEGYTIDKLIEYTYGETNRIKIEFDLEIESYFPIFDPKQEMFAGSRIENFQVNAGPTVGPGSSAGPSNDPTLGINAIETNIFKGNKLNKDQNSKYSGNWWE